MGSLRRILSLFSAILLSLPVLAHSQAYTSIVVFGDSLSDTGNDAAVSRAKYTVSAQLPGPASGYTDGRFTDGIETGPAARLYQGVWVEQLAASLPSKPSVKNSLAGGTNYAYGFAMTGPGTSTFTYGAGNVFFFQVNNIGQQVTDYLATNPIINSNTLFIVWGGANDLLHATTTTAITTSATQEVGVIQRLINAGATDFLVPNLPPLGLTPRFNTSVAASAAANQAATGFDQTLAGGLAGLPAANPGKSLHVLPLDLYTLYNTVVAAPASYGLSNVTGGAQGNVTVNPDTYLFWDDLHPTTYGHFLIATAAESLLGISLPTMTTITSSNLNVSLNSPVTLTASVSSTTSTPMGTVTFYDGTTALGSSLVKGTGITATATLTTSSLLAGPHSLTAVFIGVNGFGNSTSAAISENVASPGFTTSLNPGSLTIKSGSSATTVLTVTPVGGLSGIASFSCTSPPSRITCSFSPVSIALPGDNKPQTTTLTVSTGAFANLLLPTRPGAFAPPIYTAITFFPFAGLLGFAGVRRRKAVPRGLGLFIFLTMFSGGAALGLSGCSGGSSNNTPAGSYVVHVTTTVNNTVSTQDLSVVVQ